ncbi:MAG: M16 family metallopeptidase [Acidobacteriota bacterium]
MGAAGNRWTRVAPIVLAGSMLVMGCGGGEMKQRRGATVGERGLAMSLLPSSTSPLVTLRIQFRVGAIDDPAGKEGLNALTALMIGRGGTRDLTYREVVERLYPMAASIKAQPDREVTTFIGEVHRDHLKDFYRILADLLLEPRFDEADFERNRDLLLAGIEVNLRGNDDETLGKEALNLMLYDGHPYGRPDIGTVQGLKAIDLEDVRAHYRKHYTRDAVVLGVAGGYPEGLLDSLQEDFSSLPPKAPPRPDLPRPKPVEGMEVLIVEKPAQATAISIGHPIAVTRADDDFYPLMVANSYLGEHRTFNGRLMNVMRGERGLNYGDYSYIESFIQDGRSTFPLANIPRRQQYFSIWIRPVAHANALFALRQAVRELKRLVEEGMSGKDFEQTRNFLLNYSSLWAQTLSRRLGYQMDSQFYGSRSFIAEVRERLPRLTVGEVNAAVRRHLHPDNLKVAIVTRDAEGLRKKLLSGEPTPIVYQTPTTRADLLKEDEEIQSFPLPVTEGRVRIVSAQDLFER